MITLALIGSLVGCGTATGQPLRSSGNVTPGGGSAQASRVGPRPTSAAGPYRVEAVVDGDTLKVLRADRLVTVRLIGIDTPVI